MPEKYRNLTEYVLLLPDMFVLVTRLMKDRRVPAKSKTILTLVLSYLVLPLDIIPDFVPGLGALDDFVIVVYALNRVLISTPPEVVARHWSGKEDILKTVQDALAAIDEVMSKSVLKKLSGLLKRRSGR